VRVARDGSVHLSSIASETEVRQQANTQTTSPAPDPEARPETQPAPTAPPKPISTVAHDPSPASAPPLPVARVEASPIAAPPDGPAAPLQASESTSSPMAVVGVPAGAPRVVSAQPAASTDTAPQPVRVIAPGDLLRELESGLTAAKSPLQLSGGRRRRRRIGVFAGLAAALGVFFAVATVAIATVSDSGTVDVQVASDTLCKSGTTGAGALVFYEGKNCVDYGSSGTGVFNSFVRVQADPQESGYNTNGTLEFNTSAGTWTHAIKVSEIPVVKINGVDYWELFSDINDGNGGTDSQIQLTDLEVWFTTDANITGYGGPGFAGASKQYDFQGNILINDVNSGSGRGDLRYDIPLSGITIPPSCGYFDSSCTTYFVLYSKWGDANSGPFSSDGGFEEWKVKQYPTIELKKVWVGQPGQTTLNIGTSIGGSQVDTQLTGANGTPPLTTGTNIVGPGTFYVSETGGLTNYTSTLACTRDGTAFTPGANGAVTFTNTQNKIDTSHVVCTFTNTAIPPKLHLRKVVINDNGGTATTADFTLTANGAGSNDLSGTSPVDSGAGSLPDTWTLSETASAAASGKYTASDWVCVGGTQGDATHIAVGIGGEATCTITNDDIAPKLHLRKVVVNDNGGTATVADFTLTANGTGSNDLSGTSPVDSGAGLKADTWALSETSPSNYTASSWVCVGGTQGDATHITVGVAGEATCTITNNDVAPKLHLRKVVVNDNGGTATVADFTLTADGTGSNDLSGTSPVDSGTGLIADTWTLSETSPSNYTASAWVCVGGSQGDATHITVASGGEATCTITNNDVPPGLHLRKVVVNDNGGTATVADWTLTATGATSISGTSPVDSDNTFAAGTYTLSESGAPTGYENGTAWVCVGGTQGEATHITVGLGECATCTITNNDIPPKLHLRKVVVNDNGGTATTADFTLTADGTGTNDLSGTSPVDSGSGLLGDTWTLSETTVSGYSASAWVCVGGTQGNATHITVAIGGEATCTITNDDIAPKLHLRKVVINDNGGTATTADFTLTANGTGSNDISGASPVDSGAGLKADTWALSETHVAGYTAGNWVCVGGSQGDATHITVGIGGESTCTITNDDQAGHIIIRKITDPLESPTSFDFDATGNGYVDFSLTGQTGSNTNSQALDAGNYTVKEINIPGGWVLTGIGDPANGNNCVLTVTGSGTSTGTGDVNTSTATIHLGLGDTIRCTFENTGRGVTRTQGFWSTHTSLANIAWFGGSAFGHTFPGVANTAGIGDTLLCGRNIDTLGKLMGGFWSNVAKTTTGAKRSALDQARMQLLQQLLAAELNASAFGSSPGAGKFAAWEAAYCGTDINAIRTALGQAAGFNESGDSAVFTPGTSADAKNAKAIANRVFWDVLP
jgi:hypothetical protein